METRDPALSKTKIAETDTRETSYDSQTANDHQAVNNHDELKKTLPRTKALIPLKKAW